MQASSTSPNGNQGRALDRAGQKYTILDMALTVRGAGHTLILMSMYNGMVPKTGFLRRHRDPAYCCWLVQSGHAQIQFGAHSQRAEPGQWLFVPAWLLRDQDFAPSTRLLSLRLGCSRDDGLPPYRRQRPLVLDDDQIPDFAPLLQALLQAGGAQASGLGAMAQLAQVAAAWQELLCRQGWQSWENPVDDHLSRFIELLAQLSTPQLPWPQLEAASGRSRRQWDRCFLAATGLSTHAWLQRRFALRAAECLSDHQRSIAAIAESFGFSDGSAFARWYRRQSGLSPRQERQR